MREKAIIIFFCLCLSLCLISVTGGAWQRELRIMGEIKTDNWPLPPAATPEVPPAVTTPVDPLPEPAPTPEPEAGITPDPVVGELPEPERGEELEADVPPKSTPEPTLESPLIEEGDSGTGQETETKGELAADKEPGAGMAADTGFEIEPEFYQDTPEAYLDPLPLE